MLRWEDVMAGPSRILDTVQSSVLFPKVNLFEKSQTHSQLYGFLTDNPRYVNLGGAILGGAGGGPGGPGGPAGPMGAPAGAGRGGPIHIPMGAPAGAGRGGPLGRGRGAPARAGRGGAPHGRVPIDEPDGKEAEPSETFFERRRREKREANSQILQDAMLERRRIDTELSKLKPLPGEDLFLSSDQRMKQEELQADQLHNEIAIAEAQGQSPTKVFHKKYKRLPTNEFTDEEMRLIKQNHQEQLLQAIEMEMSELTPSELKHFRRMARGNNLTNLEDILRVIVSERFPHEDRTIRKNIVRTARQKGWPLLFTNQNSPARGVGREPKAKEFVKGIQDALKNNYTDELIRAMEIEFDFMTGDEKKKVIRNVGHHSRSDTVLEFFEEIRQSRPERNRTRIQEQVDDYLKLEGLDRLPTKKSGTTLQSQVKNLGQTFEKHEIEELRRYYNDAEIRAMEIEFDFMDEGEKQGIAEHIENFPTSTLLEHIREMMKNRGAIHRDNSIVRSRNKATAEGNTALIDIPPRTVRGTRHQMRRGTDIAPGRHLPRPGERHFPRPRRDPSEDAPPPPPPPRDDDDFRGGGGERVKRKLDFGSELSPIREGQTEDFFTPTRETSATKPPVEDDDLNFDDLFEDVEDRATTQADTKAGRGSSWTLGDVDISDDQLTDTEQLQRVVRDRDAEIFSLNQRMEDMQTNADREIERLREENDIRLEQLRANFDAESTRLREENDRRLQEQRANFDDYSTRLREENDRKLQEQRANFDDYSRQLRQENERRLSELQRQSEQMQRPADTLNQSRIELERMKEETENKLKHLTDQLEVLEQNERTLKEEINNKDQQIAQMEGGFAERLGQVQARHTNQLSNAMSGATREIQRHQTEIGIMREHINDLQEQVAQDQVERRMLEDHINQLTQRLNERTRSSGRSFSATRSSILPPEAFVSPSPARSRRRHSAETISPAHVRERTITGIVDPMRVIDARRIIKQGFEKHLTPQEIINNMADAGVFMTPWTTAHFRRFMGSWTNISNPTADDFKRAFGI